MEALSLPQLSMVEGTVQDHYKRHGVVQETVLTLV